MPCDNAPASFVLLCCDSSDLIGLLTFHVQVKPFGDIVNLIACNALMGLEQLSELRFA